ncbi:SDR family NAD(P)-dependent oxidoreductase [Streptomyces sp. DSM 15324]|uniref:SDR family NAD(P)-dependent oxidoreductase n=1 Tax=Streptomyces sp. DSM 15324 TaxID=1739111 RepID=UPI00074B0D1C|nr:glucose 1-dehydrogenase [Streptomyces sp. DSM 15324]KUO07286.1 dehydrogenase [Streptomyces sp. DSM 15324]
MTGRVEGKVCVVTGGASGIGRASAQRLADEGAIVVVTDVQDDLGEQTAQAIRKSGGRVEYLRHDVAEETAWAGVLDQVRARHGRLDVLVNNAGIGVMGPVLDTTLADFRRQIAVNLEGVFLGIKYAIPFMSEGGGGSIVNMSSTVGIIGQPMMATYGATKGGVRVLTKAVALECAAGRTGIRVNSVHPGIIDTPIWEPNGAPDLGTMSAAAVPLGTSGLPLDIANGVLWLASDESRYVTGAELVIDGGASAGGTGPLMRI